MSDSVNLGHPPAPDAARDAVHVAVVPATAVSELRPGQHLANGVVDPYRTDPVPPGGRYWLFLYPGTVTRVRHAWTHPAFPDEPTPAPKRRTEADVWAAQPEEATR